MSFNDFCKAANEPKRNQSNQIKRKREKRKKNSSTLSTGHRSFRLHSVCVLCVHDEFLMCRDHLIDREITLVRPSPPQPHSHTKRMKQRSNTVAGLMSVMDNDDEYESVVFVCHLGSWNSFVEGYGQMMWINKLRMQRTAERHSHSRYGSFALHSFVVAAGNEFGAQNCSPPWFACAFVRQFRRQRTKYDLWEINLDAPRDTLPAQWNCCHLESLRFNANSDSFFFLHLSRSLARKCTEEPVKRIPMQMILNYNFTL